MPDPAMALLIGLVFVNLGVSIVNARQLGHDKTARDAAEDAETVAKNARETAREAHRNLAQHEREHHT